jgi:hypothetical protein
LHLAEPPMTLTSGAECISLKPTVKETGLIELCVMWERAVKRHSTKLNLIPAYVFQRQKQWKQRNWTHRHRTA